MHYHLISQINQIGTVIKSLRKAAKLSQQDLADLAGVSRTALQGIEADKPTTQLDTLMRIMQALNLKLYLHHPLLSSLGENNDQNPAD